MGGLSSAASSRIVDQQMEFFLQEIIHQFGGKINDGEMVTDVIPGTVITVKTTKKEYQCRSLVITTGAWATKQLYLLELQIPLKVRFVF